MEHHIPGLAGTIAREAHVPVLECYQCGKCSAGCPLSDRMDYPPSSILRMLQMGLPEYDETVLRSNSIWLCLTCETCITRCPQEVDYPKVADYLRVESLRRNMASPEAKDIIAFHRSFLDSIRYTGRLYEIGLVGAYKLRTRHFLQDILTAPKLFIKGKLGLLPHGIKDRGSMKKIFTQTLEKR